MPKFYQNAIANSIRMLCCDIIPGMKNDCVFCAIAAGEIPSFKVYEDDLVLAYLDINPFSKGHTLVIPKQEVDYIFDLDDETYNGLMAFARRVACAMGEAIECKRVGVAVMGLEVPHAHVHLIPITAESDMNFFREKLSLPAEEMAAIAASIAEKVK